jgi:SAM-dependent methyltransferase
MPRVDYDVIAPLYDEPVRDHPVDPNLLAYLAEHPALDPAQARVLDIGCGTGKQLAADRGQFPAMSLIGLDRFAGMLRIARGRGPDIRWVQGDGAMLPFPAAHFDYITNQFSYHHIARQAQWLGEIYRVLKPGGRFAMTNIDPWIMPGWNVYRYFPAAEERDRQDFLQVDRFVALLHEIGFTRIQAGWEWYSTRQDLREFQAYAVARHRTSQLIALSDEAYQAGLDGIAQILAEAGDAPVEIESEICLVTIRADKPGDVA